MKLTHRIACAVLLATVVVPAWAALQLGQIQVKSALNQPLVAAIPLHPENLTELEGLQVGLAPAADFASAGLQVTPTDRTLRFNVVTDNNGQKLILVTSTQPITDPYLDFLVQVSTRHGKQVREFVVLLNPVIAAPAPEVQSAPVAGAPAQAAAPPPPAPPSASTAPSVAASPAPRKSAPSPAAGKTASPAPAPAATPPGGTIQVEKGDTLYEIARDQVGNGRSRINQMMLALKTANPDAFFKDNINDLKSGAILRIPTRDEIDQHSLAEANAEVHRQYEAWRASRPQRATVVEGTAAEAAANAAPKTGSGTAASDHLALTPPTGEGGGVRNRAGVAGGTGSGAADLQQQLQNDRSTLVSLQQSNDDLASRVHSLQDIADKSDKLLSLKDTTIAELQRKLADVQSGKAGTAAAASAQTAVAPAVPTQVAKPAAVERKAAGTVWFKRPLTWLVAGLVVLALVVIGLLQRRRGGATGGPLSDPEDVASAALEPEDEEARLRAELAERPDDLAVHLALCRLIHARGDEHAYIEAAKAMRVHVHDVQAPEWREVADMGEDLAPHLPLFELPSEADDYPDESAPPHAGESAVEAQVPDASEPGLVHDDDAPVEAPPVDAEAEFEPLPEAVAEPAADAEPEFTDDPVDTKLDLARAYLDMGDPVGARAMLEEVIEEGTQPQKDEARRLLAEVAG